MRFIDKVKKKLKNGTWYPFYNSFYERAAPDSRMILLESRSGKALESNILAILKELQTEPYRSFRLVLSVHADAAEEIAEKLRQYSIHVDKIVRTGSIAYYYALGRAGYLVNDTSFPGRFIKKEGQVYLNTWHGTPLKKMGRDNRLEMVTMGNVMRNLLCADYLVFPNLFMEEKMADAYMLRGLYRGTVLHEGYPRNDVFCGARRNTVPEIKKEWQGKRLFAYLPTFRGLFDRVEEEGYLLTLKDSLRKWDAGLSKEELLLVKLHPFVRAKIDFAGYVHICPFPKQWDTYEGLSVCEALITDYSSVMYDYANTGKKVILYAYDRAAYEESRGLYEDISAYPFQYAERPEQVPDFLHEEGGEASEEFLLKYATYEDGKGACKICRQVFLKEDCCRKAQFSGDGKENVLIYGGDLGQNGITTALYGMLGGMDLEKYHYYISFRMSSVREHPACMQRIPKNAGVYPLASEMNMDLFTAAALMCRMKLGWDFSWVRKRIERAYQREWRKHYGASVFRHVIHYNGYEAYIISLLQRAPCTRTIWVHNDMEQEIRMRGIQNRYLLKDAYRSYEHVVAVSGDILDSVYSISGRRDNVQVIENCHDYRSVLKRAEGEVLFDSNTDSNVSLERLKEILDSDAVKFINVGRYSPEKGHRRLIEAFAEYWRMHQNTYLLIIGGLGDLYEETVELAEATEASDHIVLMRSVSNPMPVLKRCDLFLLASHYEGLGLVLLEADTLGVPVMSCDVKGPRGFMKKHGGILLEDSKEGLIKGMELYAEGKARTLHVDYEQSNRESVKKTEALIDDIRS